MRNLSISTQIYALAALLLALTCGLSGIAYRSLSDLTGATADLDRVSAVTADVLLTERDYAALRLRLLSYLLDGREQDADRFRQLAGDIDRRMESVFPRIEEAESRGIADQIRSTVHAFADKAEALIKTHKALAEGAPALGDAAKMLRLSAASADRPFSDVLGRLARAADLASIAVQQPTRFTLAAAAEALPTDASQALPDEPARLATLVRDKIAAVKTFVDESDNSRNQLSESIRLSFEQLRTKQIARAKEIGGQANDEAGRAKFLLLCTSIVGLVLGFVIAFLVARGVSRPLKQMSIAMTRLAAGDGADEIPGLGRTNEIGAMAKAVDVFRQNADQIAAMLKAEDATREIGAIIAGAAKGDLTVRVGLADKKGFLIDIGEQVNQLLNASESAFRDFGDKARGTAVSVGEAVTAVEQVSDGAREQNFALNQLATAIKESMIAIAEVSNNTRAASDKAENSARLVERGLVAVEHLGAIVERIAQNSRRVNQITQLIAQIANRTHILSLNAAIEAARAGEHGKGFVVVAQEVGKLAESAGQNANQIADIVEQAGADAQAGKAATDQVRGAIQGISQEARATQQMIHSSAAAIEEQRATMAHIDGTVTGLKSIANSNAAAAEEITATMVQLSRLADDTRRRVEAFKTS